MENFVAYLKFYAEKKNLFEKQRQQFRRAENSLQNEAEAESLICREVTQKDKNILIPLLYATR